MAGTKFYSGKLIELEGANVVIAELNKRDEIAVPLLSLDFRGFGNRKSRVPWYMRENLEGYPYVVAANVEPSYGDKRIRGRVALFGVRASDSGLSERLDENGKQAKYPFRKDRGS